MAPWGDDGSRPDSQRRRSRRTGQGRAGRVGPRGNGRAAAAGDGLAGHRRDGVDGGAAAVVPGMSAENRSWVGLVAQAGIAAFVDWVNHPERGRAAVAGEVFGTAPRELARAVSLQQAVEMVRVTIDVVEARVDELAAPGGEAELREAVLRYTREVAFA